MTMLTVTEAARHARVTPDDIRAALAGGDLRNLTRRAVDAWNRARIAHVVTRAVTP
jgi:hypothetical protein